MAKNGETAETAHFCHPLLLSPFSLSPFLLFSFSHFSSPSSTLFSVLSFEICTHLLEKKKKKTYFQFVSKGLFKDV